MIDEKELKEIKDKSCKLTIKDDFLKVYHACESLMEENKELQDDNNRLEREAQEKRELYLNEIDRVELQNVCLKEDLNKLQSLVNELANEPFIQVFSCMYPQELWERLLAAAGNQDHITDVGKNVGGSFITKEQGEQLVRNAEERSNAMKENAAKSCEIKPVMELTNVCCETCRHDPETTNTPRSSSCKCWNCHDGGCEYGNWQPKGEK